MDRDRIQNNTAAMMTPSRTAASTIAPVKPSDPSSTSASPVGSLGGSMILTMIGGLG